MAKSKFWKYFLHAVTGPVGWITGLLGSEPVKKLLGGEPVSNLVRGMTGSGLTNAQIQNQDWQAEQAAEQRTWEEQMDNTKYQRTVADMKAAGLNPAMMYGGTASVTSAPSGAAASGGDPGSPSAGALDSILNIIFAGQRFRNLKEEGNVLRTKADEQSANAERARTEAELNRSRKTFQDLVIDWYPRLNQKEIEKIDSQIAEAYSEVDVNNVRVVNIDMDTALKQSQEFLNRIQAEWAPRLNAAREKGDLAAASRDFAEAAWKEYFRNFAINHGGQTPGYNMIAGLAASTANALEQLKGIVDSIDWGALVKSVIFGKNK